MAAYHSSTVGAVPPCRFLFQELLNAIVSDELEVLDHAHVVSGAVPRVQSLQPGAGIVAAAGAEPHQSLPKQVAASCHVGAVLAAWQATGAVGTSESLPVEIAVRILAVACAGLPG